MTAPGRAAAICCALIWATAAAAQPSPAEPQTYRMNDYRSPVPATVAGGVVVDALEAHALWEEGRTLFVDVLPRPPKPANLPAGTIWREKTRESIPGAIWLPNVGYGAIAGVTETWFRESLAEATGGDPAHPILIFCLADCWMSWNAAKRAATEFGYEKVYWFPGGTDDWALELLPLESVTAQPGEPVAR